MWARLHHARDGLPAWGPTDAFDGPPGGLRLRRATAQRARNREQAGISLPWSESDVAELVEEREDIEIFLVCREDTPVGSILLGQIDTQARTAEIGYTIQQGERGNGYATEAVELCLDHAFDDRDFHRVWAKVNRGNTGSRRVLEKAGFEEEGLLREHEYADSERVDVDVYGILRSER